MISVFGDELFADALEEEREEFWLDDFTIIDIEDARLNQPMLVWDYFSENSGSFSTFLTLYPEFNPAPVRGSPLFFDPGYHLPDYDRDGDILFEVGSQWRYSIERSDFAVMAAYLIENQLRWEPPTPGTRDSLAKKNDFVLLGFSANRAIGDMLLNFDLVLSSTKTCASVPRSVFHSDLRQWTGFSTRLPSILA